VVAIERAVDEHRPRQSQWVDGASPTVRISEAGEEDWEPAIERVKKAIRQKVLESYRNGQQAGQRVAKQTERGGR
jgi:hypothetical protein